MLNRAKCGTVAAVGCAIMTSPSGAGLELVPLGSTWKYLDDGSDQGTAWRAAGFDDSSWASGPAQLGYGDGDEATVVSFGPNSSNKYRTTYFRHTFNVANPATLPALLDLSIQRDDGAVVYLNGSEVFRSNMPAGSINYLTFASSTVSGASEDALFSQQILSSLIVPGDNVLAVEIHQRTATSSDISFDLQLEADDGIIDLERGPYIQMGGPTGATLCWRTDAPTDSIVRYGSAPGNLTDTVSSAAAVTNHAVEITGLTPDTLYYYEIADSTMALAGNDLDHSFRTAPPIGTRKPVRMWVIGDSGTGDNNADNVYNAWRTFNGATHTDVWLMLGDNAYDDGTDLEYQIAVFDTYPEQLADTFLWSTYGNHDGRSADSATQTGVYYNIFQLPGGGELGGLPSSTEAYYSFDYANVHFVCLDSYETNRAAGGPMMTWLAADLAATTQDWIIAFWHHPPYTKGSHDSDTESRLIDMRTVALPILEAGGVDLVLCGHSHSYERSILIDGHYGTSGTLTGSMIIDGGDGFAGAGGDGPYEKATLGPAANEGAVYVVAGSSGKISGGPLNHPVMHISINVLGSLVLDVDTNELHGRFLDDNGVVHDDFTIVKDPMFCIADWNGDGNLNTNDFIAYLNDFSAVFGGGSWTIGNPDLIQPFGTLNTADFIVFLNSYAAGC